MKKMQIVSIVVSLIAIVIAISGFNQSSSFGASGTRFPNGLSADTTSPVPGELRGADLTLTDDAVIGGRSLIVTTSNTSTSTAAFGCWETTSTSTATVMKVRLVASTTAISTVGVIPEVSYGACP